MSNVVKLHEPALQLIADAGIQDAAEAWAWIRREFRHMDLPLVISMSESGDDGALDCFDRLLSRYRDHKAETERLQSLPLDRVKALLAEELAIDWMAPTEPCDDDHDVMFADCGTVMVDRSGKGNWHISVTQMSHDKRDMEALARFERSMLRLSEIPGVIAVLESRRWRHGSCDHYEDGIDVICRRDIQKTA